MELLEAIEKRHSVRRFTPQKIEGEAKRQLMQAVKEANNESGLHIQLCLDEPKAFSGMMARYGKFVNANNYIALVGKKGPKLEESCGYYGQKLVLRAMQLGLNSCWVALSYSKGKAAVEVQKGEKLLMVIAIGYGQTQGAARKTKSIEELCNAPSPMPEWFLKGIQAVQLAPTAFNQQKFYFTLSGNKVSVKPLSGFYTKTELGIAKAHFEIGAQGGKWQWA